MRYILENGDVYATNIRYMNDSEEYVNGLKEIQRLANDEDLVKAWLQDRKRTDISFEDIKKVFTDENLEENMQDMEYYSISFCETNDLLSQWAIYAKEAGVSIKMKFEGESHFFTEGTEDDKDDKDNKVEWKLKPCKVYYFTYEAMVNQKRTYREEAFLILERLGEKGLDLIEGSKKCWKDISTCVKRYDFYQEAENRFVFHVDKSERAPKIAYRVDKNVLKPYLDIKCENGWPVWEIMIGPGFNQQVVFDSVVHFLENAKIKNGIASVGEYVERVWAYFEPYEQELEKSDLYVEMKEWLSDKKDAKKAFLEDARIKVGESMREICGDICRNGGWSPELKEYIKNNRFTECGTVVSKSSIPYIF